MLKEIADTIQYPDKVRLPGRRIVTWIGGDYTRNLLYNPEFHSLAICGTGIVCGLQTTYVLEKEFHCPYAEWALLEAKFATGNGRLYMAHQSGNPWKFFPSQFGWDMKPVAATINLKPFRFHTREEKDVLNGEENSGRKEIEYNFASQFDA